jgi:phosphatidylinositol dimannoside acyltransferase
MSLSRIVSHPRSLQLALSLSRWTPPAVARRTAGLLAAISAALRPEAVRNLRTNLGQVLGPAHAQDMNRITRKTLANFLQGYYDLFRAWHLPQEQLAALVRVPAWAMDGIRAAGAAGQGVVLVIPHVGSFDLVGQAVSTHLARLQVLTLPDPSPGFQSLNEMRRRGGAEVTPLSPAALRSAIRNLRRGGAVGVGGDRPVSELDRSFPFFGRPARVPSAPVRLALKTGSMVAVMASAWDAGSGEYCLDVEPFLEMERTGDEEVDLALNMRRVLDALERIIRRWLDQWYMFVPVWPELMED